MTPAQLELIATFRSIALTDRDDPRLEDLFSECETQGISAVAMVAIGEAPDWMSDKAIAAVEADLARLEDEA